jgi:hypothetical protein
MQNLFAPPVQCLVRHGRTLVGHHEHDFPAQTLFVELECGFAFALEREVRIQLHKHAPLSFVEQNFVHQLKNTPIVSLGIRDETTLENTPLTLIRIANPT